MTRLEDLNENLNLLDATLEDLKTRRHDLRDEISEKTLESKGLARGDIARVNYGKCLFTRATIQETYMVLDVRWKKGEPHAVVVPCCDSTIVEEDQKTLTVPVSELEKV